VCLPAAQCITHHSDGLGAALDKTSQLMSDEVCAAAAAHSALAALVGMCSSVIPCSPYIWSHCGQIAQLMSEVKYVLLQMPIWHLLRSLACAAQCSCSVHVSALSLLHTLRWLPTGWGVDDAGFTEYYQTWLRHWRLDNSIIQRGVTSDNRSRPLAFFPKVVCRVSSRRGASIDVFRSESENAKYFTVVAESQQTYASVSFRIKPNKCTSSCMAPVCESNTKRAATASSAPGNAPQALNLNLLDVNLFAPPPDPLPFDPP